MHVHDFDAVIKCFSHADNSSFTQSYCHYVISLLFCVCVCVCVAKSLPINVNFTTTLVNHANEESMCYNLTFQWNSPLPLYNSTLRLKHVEISEWTTFIKYSFSTDSDKQNGTILVGHNAHVSMLTVSGLNESTLIEGRTGLFWLEIDITLSNGTVLSLYSPHKLASIPICGGSTGTAPTHTCIAHISILLLLPEWVMLLVSKKSSCIMLFT